MLENRGGLTQLALVSCVTHLMPMSNDQIYSRTTARATRTSRPGFGAAQARGPVLDQEGREIPQRRRGRDGAARGRRLRRDVPRQRPHHAAAAALDGQATALGRCGAARLAKLSEGTTQPRL